MNAFAVMPCTCSPTRVVSTVTPVANIPSVRRKAIAGSPSRSPTSICSGSGRRRTRSRRGPRAHRARTRRGRRARTPWEAARRCSWRDCAARRGAAQARCESRGFECLLEQHEQRLAHSRQPARRTAKPAPARRRSRRGSACCPTRGRRSACRPSSRSSRASREAALRTRPSSSTSAARVVIVRGVKPTSGSAGSSTSPKASITLPAAVA